MVGVSYDNNSKKILLLQKNLKTKSINDNRTAQRVCTHNVKPLYSIPLETSYSTKERHGRDRWFLHFQLSRGFYCRLWMKKRLGEVEHQSNFSFIKS